MKIIVICGGGRRAGKTTLATALAGILPDSRAVKIGEHPPRDDKNPYYFEIGAVDLSDVREAVGDCAYLIIESGAILDDPQLSPDLVVFLPARGAPDKPGSERRRARAHLIRGEQASAAERESIRARLDLGPELFGRVLEAVGVPS